MNRSKTSNKPVRGKVVILVAPSGSGKTTMARRLLKDIGELRFSVSATTRPPRSGEHDGIDYHFLSQDVFQQYIDEDKFLEWEEFYNGKRYGTLKDEVEKMLNSGYFILFDVEVKGALNLKQHYKDQSLAIFIKPPSLKVLIERLEKRKSETKASIKERLERAKMELGYENRFDHVVVNNALELSYRKIKQIVTDYIQQTHTT